MTAHDRATKILAAFDENVLRDPLFSRYEGNTWLTDAIAGAIETAVADALAAQPAPTVRDALAMIASAIGGPGVDVVVTLTTTQRALGGAL